MLKPYSEDLRCQIFAVCEEGELTRREQPALSHVSVAFIQKVLRCWRNAGQVTAKPPAGDRPAALSEPTLEQVRARVAA